jgi:hypothetical protein
VVGAVHSVSLLPAPAVRFIFNSSCLPCLA